MILKKNKYKIVLSEETATYIGTIDFRCLEITYLGTASLVSLLSQNYIIKKSHNKIYIFNIGRVNNTEENINLDLFKYKGKALFPRAEIIDVDKNIDNIFISKAPIQIWSALYKKDDVGIDWAYLNDKWEDIDFDGRNNKYSYIHRHADKNQETGITTTTREIRKK